MKLGSINIRKRNQVSQNTVRRALTYTISMSIKVIQATLLITAIATAILATTDLGSTVVAVTAFSLSVGRTGRNFHPTNIDSTFKKHRNQYHHRSNKNSQTSAMMRTSLNSKTSSIFRVITQGRSCCSQRNHLMIMNMSTSTNISSSSSTLPKLITISESKWRSEAHRHSQRIRSLLEPGLTHIDDPINSGLKRQQKQMNKHQPHSNDKKNQHQSSMQSNTQSNDTGIKNELQTYYKSQEKQWTGLDGKNPIFNFLIEYYGLKGVRGPKRLGRWSPDPKLLLLQPQTTRIKEMASERGGKNESRNNNHDDNRSEIESGIHVQILPDVNDYISDGHNNMNEQLLSDIMIASKGQGGIFLENANEDDLSSVLHLRGSIPVVMNTCTSQSSLETNTNSIHGILYNPSLFYNRLEVNNKPSSEEKQQILKTIAPFQWFKSILQTTLNSEPIFHCHGLHEWAMLYHPPGAALPPSAKYQKDLPIRVSRETINAAVERRGISCTHVDALRFFAPAAGPLNHHGSSLLRTQQLQLEQKGCVHAHMDLLKIALKLQSFLDSDLLCDALETSIAARRLDVEASPYDVTAYGGGVVPVETEEGRRLYRQRQRELMELAEPVRKRLLDAYSVFLSLSFDEKFLNGDSRSVTVDANNVTDNDNSLNQNGNNDSDENYKKHGLEAGNTQKEKSRNDDQTSENEQYAAPERFAKAEPGGLSWRKNLVKR